MPIRGFDGLTPIGDVEFELDLPPFPDDSLHETVAGFMMHILRKQPKRTDQLLVTRLPPGS